jgi:hypothetical protein
MKAAFLLICLALLAGRYVQGQSVLTAEEISKLVPSEFKGYYEDGDSKSSLVKMGDIRYSLCERRFFRTKQKIKILLFDYKEAPIMYKQAMRKWNHEVVVTDTLILRNIERENCTGWESYNKQAGTAQIFLGICDRFFLMISGENVELTSLQNVLATFPFQAYPK